MGIFKVHINQPRQTYHSASVCRILSKSDHPRQSYDVISFLRWRPRQCNSTSVLPLSVFMISLISEGRNLPAYQISARYLNPRLSYYYFRFRKTIVRHVAIVLPVRIFTFASPWACHSASAYQISSKSDYPRQSYDVISIFQDGGHGISILLPVSVFVISLISEGRNLNAYQTSARYLNPRL